MPLPTLLDYRTLLIASGIVGGALLMLLAIQIRHPYPGFLRMVLAMDILAAALILGGLMGYAPDSVWILQVTVLATFGLTDSGLRTFCALPPRGRLSLLYVPAAMALQLLIYFTQPLYVAIIATSALLIPLALDVAVQLLRADPPAGRRFGYCFVAFVGLFTCATSLVRLGAMAMLRNEASPYFYASLGNTAFFLMVLVLVVSMSFGITTLAHERLVAELEMEHAARLRAQDRLAKAERSAMVGRIVGGVAHFFNNQMAIVQLASAMLRDSLGASNAAAAPLVDQIDGASLRAATITTRLQQYAQARMLRSSRFDPSRLVDEILPEIRAAAGDAVEVVFTAESPLPAVELDPDLSREALLVLARNARDAMPSGGTLTISVREEIVDPYRAEQLGLTSGPYVLVSVADTGNGMDDEVQRHLFEPFFTTKGLARGEGLGLASAFGFIRQSGGTITVRSGSGQGAEFELYLPTRSRAV